MATGMTSNQRGNDLRESASNLASNAADKARQAIDSAQQTAHNAAHRAGDYVADAQHRAGDFVAGAQHRAKEAASNVGEYFSEHNMSGVVHDATSLIRRYPIPAMLVGIGVGVLLACGLRRDSE